MFLLDGAAVEHLLLSNAYSWCAGTGIDSEQPTPWPKGEEKGCYMGGANLGAQDLGKKMNKLLELSTTSRKRVKRLLLVRTAFHLWKRWPFSPFVQAWAGFLHISNNLICAWMEKTDTESTLLLCFAQQGGLAERKNSWKNGHLQVEEVRCEDQVVCLLV